MNETKICVIGLGYVGLPLARLFSTKYKTIGFDMNQARVTALMAGHDATLEVSDELLQSALANGFKCTANIEEIRDYNFYVVAVPTPVDKNNNPDLTPLYGASTTVGKVISKGDIVVYESTVYPGVTEDECIPVVEKVSGLKFNEDFFAGYTSRANRRLRALPPPLCATCSKTLPPAPRVPAAWRRCPAGSPTAKLVPRMRMNITGLSAAPATRWPACGAVMRLPRRLAMKPIIQKPFGGKS